MHKTDDVKKIISVLKEL